MSVAKELLKTNVQQSLRKRHTRAGQVLNDVHSQLNATRVRRSIEPVSLAALQALAQRARTTTRHKMNNERR